MKNSEMEELVPQYLKGALQADEARAFDAWLRESPGASSRVTTWKWIRAALLGRPMKTPPAGALPSIVARVRALEGRSLHRRTVWYAHVLGVTMALLVMIALWISVKPGIVLEWNVNGEAPSSFQVYRAQVGEGEYRLIEEIDARENMDRYRYIDLWLIPGKEYSYRIVGLEHEDLLAMSNVMNSSTLGVLPGQLAILLISCLFGYFVVILIQMLPDLSIKVGARQS